MSNTLISSNCPDSANAAYHASPGRSSSEVAAYVDDALQWFHWYVLKDWERAPTKPMKLGTAVHDMIEISLPLMVSLGGWDTLVREIPKEVLNAKGHCMGSAWTDWKEVNPAEVYFKPWEQNPLRIVWDNLMSNSWTRDFVLRSRKEVAHHWDDEDFGPCKVKFDALACPVFSDWKTTSKRTKREFELDVVRRAYDLRLAFYRRGYRDLFGDEPEIYIVAINTSGGFQVNPYRMPTEWLDDAEARLIMTIDEMDNFDVSKYLDGKPQVLRQPNFSKAKFNELDD